MIKNLIANHQLEEAIDVILTTSSPLPNQKLYNQTILQSARLSSAKRDRASGVLRVDDYNLTLNRVADALLSIVADLEKEYPKIFTELPNMKSNSQNFPINEIEYFFKKYRTRFPEAATATEEVLDNISSFNSEKRKYSGNEFDPDNIRYNQIMTQWRLVKDMVSKYERQKKENTIIQIRTLLQDKSEAAIVRACNALMTVDSGNPEWSRIREGCQGSLSDWEIDIAIEKIEDKLNTY